MLRLQQAKSLQGKAQVVLACVEKASQVTRGPLLTHPEKSC